MVRTSILAKALDYKMGRGIWKRLLNNHPGEYLLTSCGLLVQVVQFNTVRWLEHEHPITSPFFC